MPTVSLPYKIIRDLDNSCFNTQRVQNQTIYAPAPYGYSPIYHSFFPSYREVHHIHHHDSGYSSRYSSNHSSKTDKKNKEPNYPSTPAIIAMTAFTLFMTYTVGKDLKTVWNASSKIKQIDQKFFRIESFLNHTLMTNDEKNEIYQRSEDIYEAEANYINTEYSSALTSGIIKLMMLTSAGVTAYAYYMNPAYMTAGLVSSGVSALAWAFNLGFDNSETELIKLSSFIDSNVHQLKQKFYTQIPAFNRFN